MPHPGHGVDVPDAETACDGLPPGPKMLADASSVPDTEAEGIHSAGSQLCEKTITELEVENRKSPGEVTVKVPSIASCTTQESVSLKQLRSTNMPVEFAAPLRP